MVATAALSTCTSGADCDDGNGCTADRCLDGVCAHLAVGDSTCCNQDDDCTPMPCKATACRTIPGRSYSTCTYTPVPACCLTDVACSDRDACTADMCDVLTHTCSHAAIPGCCVVTADCDEGDVCVNGSCTPGTAEATWVRLPAAGLADTRIRALAVDGSGHIFAVAWGYGVYRSTDDGATFTKLGVPNTTNDPGGLAITTLGLNSLGEPVIGVIPPGSGTSTKLLYRYDGASNTWISSTATQPINLGGYFPPAIRRGIDGELLSSWPFRNDIMRSLDDGNTWTNAFPIPNAAHTPPNGPSPSVKAVYGVAVHPRSGELFCGTEGDQWWHSTDEGSSWSMVDEEGTSSIGAEPGQNGFLIAFNKDGEPLIGTQGKPDGKFLMRLRSDGKVVSSCEGFPAWGMVGTSTMSTVLREVALTDEGHNFMAMPVADGKGGSLPCDLWGSADGSSWQKLSAPFVPELNALVADGDSVLVGGGAASTGVIWRYTPAIVNRLPLVDTGFAAGESPSCGLSGLALDGSAVDPEGATVSMTWKARGPGVVTFADPGAAATTATFSTPGDYVLTLHATDGVRSAGAPVIVHVLP